ncbi:MAG: AraC family transcriptional regulator [Brasilonema angustatum HA4187-MV1]|jgi:AraC-like DNA-binding protein|nr:AraC family transcriptional regulator [Brasilonema angustatum HA4187-MV1]
MGLHAVSIKLVQGILSAALAADSDLEAEQMLAAIGLYPEILKDADVYISHEKFIALWVELVRCSGNPSIGLRMAEFAQPSCWDVVGYAVESSPNLNEAMRRIVRSVRVLHEEAEMTFEVKGKVARLTHTVPSFPISPYRANCDWVVAGIFLLIRRITGVDFVPLKVGFQYSLPEDISAYHRLFRAPLKFGQPVNEIAFDSTFLSSPLLKSYPGLGRVLDRYIEDLLAKLPHSESFIDSVRREISIELRGGNLGVEVIAKRLGFVPRTLQRKLKEAGSSYQELLDEMRRSLSIHYLQEQHMAVSEVAFLLGFSEASAFYRAFKRWTGTTPSEFRRTLKLTNDK